MSARPSASRTGRVLTAAAVATAMTAAVAGPATAAPGIPPSFWVDSPSGTLTTREAVLTLVDASGGEDAPVSATLDVNGQIQSWPDVSVPYVLSGLADGYYSVNVIASDADGDSAPWYLEFSVDATAPAFDLTALGDLGAVRVGDEVGVRAVTADGDLERFDVSLDGQAVDQAFWNDATFYLSAGDPGAHTVSVEAFDHVGNSSVQTLGFSTLEPVVVQAPTVEDASMEVTIHDVVEIDLDDLVTPGTGEIASVEVTGWSDALGLSYDEVTHVVTLEPWITGQYSFWFAATGLTEGADGQDERSADGVVSVLVVDEPVGPAPVISWVAKPAASTSSTSAHFEVAVDSPDAVVSYVLDLPPGAQSASPVYVTGTSFDVTGLSVGRHTIRVVVEVGSAFSALDHVWDVTGAGTPAPPSTPVVTPPAAPVLSSDAIPASVISKGIRKGASGESVAIIQRVVGAVPDGRFGPATRAAVIRFQRAHGLAADGIVGPLTWAVIVKVANGGSGVAAPAGSTSIPAAQIARGIQQGASGTSVVVIQRIVGADADGLFGPRTKAAVQAWQRAHGLVADGIVGRLTWAAMTAR